MCPNDSTEERRVKKPEAPAPPAPAPAPPATAPAPPATAPAPPAPAPAPAPLEKSTAIVPVQTPTAMEPVEQIPQKIIPAPAPAPLQSAKPYSIQAQQATAPLVQSPAPVPKGKKTKETPSPPKMGKKNYQQHRYSIRILKGSFLPILFGIFSFQLLSSYTYRWPDRFSFDYMVILIGFLMGFGITSGITIGNMIRAKNKKLKVSDSPWAGVDINVAAGALLALPFLIIVILLGLFFSLAQAWQLAMGFFLAAIFPTLFVIIFELASKGKFFIREIPTPPTIKTKLVFVPS